MVRTLAGVVGKERFRGKRRVSGDESGVALAQPLTSVGITSDADSSNCNKNIHTLIRKAAIGIAVKGRQAFRRDKMEKCDFGTATKARL
ncbi:unnamed protein product [Ceratitis capitata]|uniref:(Mediterranean fruit fly) hypothetical protein n=1 Tax=Ceratitis capitata TaxID=7213 RepID=A0A811UPU3_CERCA|nr:unnamed protein product [Ceratitis capitata]